MAQKVDFEPFSLLGINYVCSSNPTWLRGLTHTHRERERERERDI
jgi:hypothetical protein